MSFDTVDEEMTMERYNSLVKFWRKHPPTAVLIAGYVGYKPPDADANTEADPDEEMDDESMTALAQVFGLPVRIKGNQQ